MTTVPGIFSNSSGPSEHLTKLADSVADFVRRSGGVARMRGLRDAGREYDQAIWKQMAGLGWLGILIPEKYGGLGLGLSEMAVVAEGLARSLAPEPLNAVAVLATGVLLGAENETLKAEQLPRLVRGEIAPVLAWQEEAGKLDPAAVNTQAVAFEGGFGITGDKKYIAGAAQADAFLVSARTGDEISLYWVPRETPGVTLHLESIADGRFFGTLTLKDASLSKDLCISRGTAARSALEASIDHATAIAAAELCGVMVRALEITLDYMKTRVAFGKPIGSFQALQHRAVDLYMHSQFSCAVVEETVQTMTSRLDGGSRAMFASRVKARCSDAALRIARDSIQIHGAMGFTDECDIGLYLKRALVLSAWLGSASHHRRRYAELSVGEEL